MMTWMGFGMQWWMWLSVMAGIVLFWLLIVFLVREITPGRRAATPAPSEALDVLGRRLATGEINPEEYTRLRSILTDRR